MDVIIVIEMIGTGRCDINGVIGYFDIFVVLLL